MTSIFDFIEELTQADRAVVNSMPFDPQSRRFYDAFHGSLVWLDERPELIASAGHALYVELLFARSLLFHYPQAGIPAYRDAPDRSLFWQTALAAIPLWPGFQRATLDQDSRNYLVQQMNRDDHF